MKLRIPKLSHSRKWDIAISTAIVIAYTLFAYFSRKSSFPDNVELFSENLSSQLIPVDCKLDSSGYGVSISLGNGFSTHFDTVITFDDESTLLIIAYSNTKTGSTLTASSPYPKKIQEVYSKSEFKKFTHGLLKDTCNKAWADYQSEAKKKSDEANNVKSWAATK